MSREEYRAAIGHYPGALESPPALPKTASSLEAARQIARTNHPDIAQAQHSVRVADMNVELAKAALKPKLSASANAGIAQGGTNSSSVGVALSGPIYRGGGIASSMRRAEAQRDAVRAGLLLAGQGIDQNVGNAWSQLNVAEAGLTASEEQIRASRVAFSGVREEASLGARTTLDVLNAEQELLDAQAAQISAQSNRYVAVYNLLAAMGLLNTQYLGLGIATYDPAAYYNAVRNAPLAAVSPEGKKLGHVLKALGKQ